MIIIIIIIINKDKTPSIKNIKLYHKTNWEHFNEHLTESYHGYSSNNQLNLNDINMITKHIDNTSEWLTNNIKIMSDQLIPTTTIKENSTPLSINIRQKNKRKKKNYRPISLINCLGKLLEKIITDKLYSFVNTNNIINKEQSGFQKNKSTYDHLFQLTQSVSQNFNRKHRTAALFLDIDKAFDRVWHDGLRYKLIKANIPVSFIRWISNFLKDRKIQVKIENEKSEYLIPFNGVPQGSSLSPLLFLIYVADIPKGGKNVNTSQFADDIAIWTSITQPEKTNKNLQENLNKLKDWCNKWRIGLNAGKTKLLIFSKMNRKHNETLNLKINGVKINEYGEVKFLGITLDSALTLKRHMEIIKAETAKQLNVLYKLKGVQYGPSTKTPIHLFNTYVRSKMEYGSPCTIIAPDSSFQLLQVIQNKFLRYALNTGFISTPNYIETCEYIQHKEQN